MEISGKTQLLGLIGSPVGHSKSPEMYNYCFQKFNRDYAYLAFDVDEAHVEEAVKAIRTLHMKGANVTMPLKTAVIPYVDKMTPAALATNAVNTIVNEEGILVGYCTDGMGFTANLASGDVSVKDQKITILGGGGVSSAVSAQCALEGARELSIFNRKDKFWPRLEEHVERIHAAAPKCQVDIFDLEDEAELKKQIKDSQILVNASRVGMPPLEEETLVKDTSVFREDLVVAEVVYEPRETRFLRDARAAGCRQIFAGMGMLLRQGAAALKLYTGDTMPVEEIEANLY